MCPVWQKKTLICSHINSFLPVVKLALPSASLLSSLVQERAAVASKREGTLPQPVTLVDTKL